MNKKRKFETKNVLIGYLIYLFLPIVIFQLHVSLCFVEIYGQSIFLSAPIIMLFLSSRYSAKEYGEDLVEQRIKLMNQSVTRLIDESWKNQIRQEAKVAWNVSTGLGIILLILFWGLFIKTTIQYGLFPICS